MRLGISDAWPDVPPRGAPRVALPFNEYAFQPLLVGGVIGGAAAVTLSSWAAPSVRWRRTLAATAGLLALLIALGHTLQVVDGELGERREARLLVIALVGFALVSGVVGLLAGAVLARGRHGLAWPVAAALVAGLAGPWLNDLVHRSPALDGSWTDTIARWHPWVGGALLGICLGVWGARPAVRLIGTVAALAVLWVVPAALTALGYVTYYGTRTSPSRQTVSEVLDSGRDVFVEALKQTSAPVVGPLILALLLGLVGAVVTGSRSRPTPAVAPTA
ncbi:hypothetical protein PZ938_08305 [Luteipulveratus sp. YIM 133132]|uniref:hypothetical protein n=1 Tax=Luteipulveratus flavus TaxID=3031728 RepID=UPI0023AFC146|nr:hypothetical protein [Luteipulveratus sp. YIM 133132]MDE9365607.1 hypothetical protein [Luteipulveratus sp. YIM 133132]